MSILSLKASKPERRLADLLQLRVYAASIVMAIILLLLVGKIILDARANLLRSIERDLESHQQIIVLNLRESLNLVDFTLKRARKEWVQTGRLRSHDEYVEDFPNFKALIKQIGIIDARGYLVTSSLSQQAPTLYLGDREHFRVHVGATSDEIFISKPVVGRVSGQNSLQFTRPILDANKNFLGVIVVSLNPDYIVETNFKALSLVGVTGALVGRDGQQRVSMQTLGNPSASSQHEVKAEEGSFLRTAYPTAVFDESYYWKRSELIGYPLDLIVGIPKSQVERRIEYVYWGAGIVGSLMLLAILLYTLNISALIRSRNTLLLKLEASNIKANSANAMKSKFVSGISHELRTPLNGILGFSELIDMSSSIEEAKKFGAIIHASAQHLHQLVNTLLDLAKIEAGQMAVVRTSANVQDLFDSVVSLHRFEAERQGVLLSLNLAQPMPSHIYTDRIKLMQVLNNLISNAVKFTNEGAIFVNVSHSEKSWTIAVADTGVGMSPEQMAGIFDRFNNIKLDNADTTEKQGAGLGMALCKELVELMDGTIEVRSERNVGTVVEVKLKEVHVEDTD